MLALKPYFQLMRFHKPAGILLLWFPTAWALWIANQGHPPAILTFYFFLGTILMRSAGCIVNDIADRHVDKHVQRTKTRPLTAGKINLGAAFLLLLLLFIAAFFIVIQLPSVCFYYALLALFITVLYPFCKRFFQAPQLILGLAFSMGIPMAFAASQVPPDISMYMLFILNFAWIIAYDTMYAMADREDDLRIGVKSIAILFAQYDWLFILILQIFFHLMWLLLITSLPNPKLFYIAWFASTFILLYQQWLLFKQNNISCLTAFSTNVWYGLVMWIALIGGYK